jgi:hypothetical protein
MIVTVPHVDTIAKSGYRCDGSPMGIDDSFYDANRRNHEVVGTARIFLNEVMVGWLYRTSDDRLFAQVTPNMPLADQRSLGIPKPTYDPGFQVAKDQHGPLRYSALAPLANWPVDRLQLRTCDK